jgi:cephalosporin hydroxylase
MGVDPQGALRRFVAPRVDVLVRRRYRTLSRRRAPDPALDDVTLDGFGRVVRRAVRDGAAPSAKLDRTMAKALRRLGDADISGQRRSPALRRALVDQFHRLYYHSSRQTWKDTRFLGVPVWKSPLDLWLYQELIPELRPDVLIEAGTKYGGSAYYFARLFDLLGHGRVITIDVEAQPGRPEHPRITYLSGSSADTAVADRVMGMVGDGKPLIVLDSAHRRDHVLAELRLWSPRVPLGSYIVVEDTHADGHPVTTRFGPGPWDAVERFLAENTAFEIDESMHKFFMTFNPRGYLKRVR